MYYLLLRLFPPPPPPITSGYRGGLLLSTYLIRNTERKDWYFFFEQLQMFLVQLDVQRRICPNTPMERSYTVEWARSERGFLCLPVEVPVKVHHNNSDVVTIHPHVGVRNTQTHAYGHVILSAERFTNQTRRCIVEITSGAFRIESDVVGPSVAHRPPAKLAHVLLNIMDHLLVAQHIPQSIRRQHQEPVRTLKLV